MLYTEKLESASIELSDFLNDTLIEAKQKPRKIELEPKVFNVAELIESLAQTTPILAQKQNNTLQVQCDPEVGPIFTDPQRLRQVLLNLLSNACKFTENGTILLSVRRDTESEQPMIVFTVSDTGAGISPERMENVFDWQTIESLTSWGAPTHQKGARGLGLMISARLTELMNGSITVESEVGKGSTFRVMLPAQQ